MIKKKKSLTKELHKKTFIDIFALTNIFVVRKKKYTDAFTLHRLNYLC